MSIINEPPLNNSGDSASLVTQQSDSVAMLYNLCEDGVKTLLSFCGLSSTTPDYADDETLTPDQWVQKWSKFVFYADFSTESSNLCGSLPFSRSIDSMNGQIYKMALNSARIKHRLRNLNYDVTQSMSLMNEVKFVVLHVSIPLGGTWY